MKFAAASSATAATPGGGSRTEDAIVPVSERDGVDHADLGPSGSDSFTELKERYGFESVEDWHLVADYSGGFRHGDVESEFLWP
mgnify:CR=1 FL=1